MSPYNVSKTGVVALSEALSAELTDSGVSVTVLCPMFFKTNIAAAARGSESIDESRRGFIERVMGYTRVQAPQVATIALDAVERGKLYAVPHPSGRWFWRLKRVAPAGYFGLVRIGKRRGVMG